MKIIIFIMILGLFLFENVSADINPKNPLVLVVMSYHENFHWSRSIKKGIEDRLGNRARLHYIYLDSKTDPKGAHEKARHAYSFYQENRPEGVIAVDDNAQSFFVVPYLKNKFNTPVVFAGVNAAPSAYGYPNNHISGIIERNHIHESIAILKRIEPEIMSIGFLFKKSPSGFALAEQVRSEDKRYLAKNCGMELVSNEYDFIIASQRLGMKCDAVYIDGAAGIKDKNGQEMPYELLIRYLNKDFNGMVVGGNSFHVYSGALLSVAKSGYEQGEVAASMLVMAMDGTPMKELPVTRNYQGDYYINAIALKRSGLKFDFKSFKRIKVIEGL